MSARVGMALAVLALGAVGLLVAAPADRCPAKNATNWLKHYDAACDTLVAAANDCSLCHVTVEVLNPYGADLATVANQPWLVEDRDSDGDGRDNATEVADCTRPGVPDIPLVTDSATWGAWKVRWR